MSKSNRREGRNWLIYYLYSRNEHDECLRLIEEIMKETNNRNEAAVYIQGMIFRSRGKIAESLDCFKWAQKLNPFSIDCMKQVGKSLYLIGRTKAAIDIYDQTLKINPDDWEVWHNKGVCHMNKEEYELAIDSFRGANLIQKHDATFMQLGEVYVRQEDYKSAIDVYLEALEFSPENPEILTTLGLLYLRLGDSPKAFQYLGNALTLDPVNSKALLATGSIIQDRSDHDAALLKYRIVAVHNPNSAPLWNNIGMCFFGKSKYIAAIVCLKKALYLDPFEWITAFNLGIVHLATEQFVSAFHYFNSAITLNPFYATSYMYLGVTLSNLEDYDNAMIAYEKAVSLEEDFLIYLNYAITLHTCGNREKAIEMYLKCNTLFNNLGSKVNDLDSEIINKKRKLGLDLGIS